MDDDLMRVWESTQGTTVCTCRLCRNLGVHELENEYNWEWAERSLTRNEWMFHADGLAPLYMERQRLKREREEKDIRSKLWLTRKSWWRRLLGRMHRGK